MSDKEGFLAPDEANMQLTREEEKTPCLPRPIRSRQKVMQVSCQL
jgi:hypothetical protein